MHGNEDQANSGLQWESGANGDDQIYIWTSFGDPGWQIATGVTPILEEWVHWGLTYDGFDVTLYQNGEVGLRGFPTGDADARL